jgi:hypothetical protein
VDVAAMLEITYQKVIPYPVDVVLSQYYDYEQISHVHTRTLEEYTWLKFAATRRCTNRCGLGACWEGSAVNIDSKYNSLRIM